MRTTILTVFLHLFIMTTASIAEELMWNEGSVSKYFDSAPASQLLSTSKYEAYQKLINKKDCGPAALLLNKAFVKRYPQFSNVAAPRGEQFIRWFVYYVSHEFPDLNFCMDSLELKQHEMMLAQSGTKVGKYFRGSFRKPPLLYWEGWRKRDRFVRGIIHRAAKDHPPALLEIAKLVRRGDVFKLGADFEFYLIRRACHLGIPCKAHKKRLNELKKSISPENATRMASLASSENIVLKKLGRKNNL
jgi:hypothetical protein